jgi:hypothetical protein
MQCFTKKIQKIKNNMLSAGNQLNVYDGDDAGVNCFSAWPGLGFGHRCRSWGGVSDGQHALGCNQDLHAGRLLLQSLKIGVPLSGWL